MQSIKHHLVTAKDVQRLAPSLPLDQHKYQAGMVTAWVGSPGMMGAASLSCEAALRSGAGYVRWLYASEAQSLVAPYMRPVEVVQKGFAASERETIVPLLQASGSCLMGCGLGRSAAVKDGLGAWLPNVQVPLVVDGDGLFFFADSPCALPASVIFTPHLGELAHLLRMRHIRQTEVEAILPTAMLFAQRHRICLVLKGHPSFILDPETHTAFICAGGSPGMATAGSGDVLAGLLAGLLAQGLLSLHAAIAGVWLHQKAGESAAKEKTPRCMIASDLLTQFPSAFRSVHW